MYCSHFGLHRPPFNNTPDPSFYFGTPEHEEALATLEYATVERKGFVLLTGDIGAGKTLVGRMFLRRIESRATTAVITHTQLSGRQLMAALCAEFELVVPPEASNLQLADRLQTFLLEQYAQDRLVVVLLDEAQNLPDESFEAVRMLGNLEADDAKLIQICILGQPELRGRFAQPAMSQLNQRLFRRFHLSALTRAQTDEYIRHRLRTAGWSGGELFTQAAVDRIFADTKGTPRLINRLCDNALLTAYGRGQRTVDADIIDEMAGTRTEARPSHSPGRAAQSAPGADPVLAGTGEDRLSRNDLRGNVRPWLDAGSTLAEYRHRVVRAVDDVVGRCEATEDRLAELTTRLGESDRDVRTLVQKTAQGLADLNSHVKDLESRCSSAAEIDRVRAECSAGMTETLRRLSEQAESLEKLRQECAGAMEAAGARQQSQVEDSARRLESQADALRRLGEEVAARQAGLQDRIESLTGQIARSGGRVEELRNQITAQKSEIEAQVGQVAGRLEALSREAAVLRENAVTRLEFQQLQAEQTAMSRAQARQSAALEDLKDEHVQAVADLQRNVAQHENAVQDLGRQVRERMSAIEEALGSLRDASASARELEDLRAEQSAALAEMGRRVTTEAEALARLQDLLNQQTGTRSGEEEMVHAGLSRQMMAQARRVRDLRHRLARMGAAIEGRLDGLGRELAVLRTEMATRQDLEQAQALQTASLDGLKDEHARAVADIHHDLAHHENAFRDLDRRLRDRMAAVEQTVESLRGTSVSGGDLENLRNQQAQALAGMDRRLAEEAEVLVYLRQALDEHAGALSGQQSAIREDLTRRMLAHARRTQDLRRRLARLQAAFNGRLEECGRELAAMREEMATREDLEQVRIDQSAALAGLKDEQARVVAGIRDGLAQHEDLVEGLGREVRDRMALLEQASASLRDRAASGEDLERFRAQQAEALAGMDRRLDAESEALVLLRQTVDEQAGALAGAQQAAKEELFRRMLVQAQRVRHLRGGLAHLRVAIEGRLDGLGRELADLREEMATRQDLELVRAQHSAALDGLKDQHARAVADIQSDLAQHESRVGTLARQVGERMTVLEQAFDAWRSSSASAQNVETLRDQQVQVLAEVDRRLGEEAETLVRLQQILEERTGVLSGDQSLLREDLTRRMLKHARRVRDLRTRIARLQSATEGRLEECGRKLAALREEMATHRDLEEAQVRQSAALDSLKSDQAQAVADLRSGLARHENTVADLSRQIDERTAALEDIRSEHARSLADIQSDLAAHESRVQDLGRQLRERMTGFEQSLDTLREASASAGELENLRAEQAVVAAEMARRLALESETLTALKRDFDARSGQLSSDQQSLKEGLSRRILSQARWVRDLRQRLANMQASTEARLNVLAGDVREGRQMLVELDAKLGGHERELRALDERMDDRFAEARRALEEQQARSVTREDLERLRENHSGALDDIARRLAREAGELRQFKEAMERQSASASEAQQAGMAAMEECVDIQTQRVQDLYRRLAEEQQSLNARLEEMSRRFVGRDELEAQRQAMETLIDGVVQRCRTVQEQLDSLSSSKAEATDVTSLGQRQEQVTSELLEKLEGQKEVVRAKFEDLLAHWQRTDSELARLASTTAPVEEMAALRERQEHDTQRTLAALVAQRRDLEGLLVDVGRRCDTFATRLAILPDDLDAIRREHAEQIRSVCEHMDTGKLQIDAALHDVTERCRQAQEQITALAERAASAEDVEAVRETHARDLGALVQRLDRADSEHQQELGEINQKWSELAQGVCAVAATAAPAANFAALEDAINENLSDMRSRLENAHKRHKEDLRSMVWTVQQLAARVQAVENADRPAPVKIELMPEVGRDLANLTDQARHERDELSRLSQAIDQARRELTDTTGNADAARRGLAEAAGTVDASIQQWRSGAAGIDEKAAELRESARAAGELLKGMQHVAQALDGKINSRRWQEELTRGEALAGRLERIVNEAGVVCGRLNAALRDFEHCRDEADVWTIRCTEARQLTVALAKLLKAGRQMGTNLETELDGRKRMLSALARNTAGLVDVIESARRSEGLGVRAEDLAGSAAAPASRRGRLDLGAEDDAASRLDWPSALETADRLATDVTTH